MINIDSLSKYLKLYTSFWIEKYWEQIKYNSTIINLKDKEWPFALYNQAVWLMISNQNQNTITVYYLQDLINNYLKELAILNWIDINSYWWTSKLFYKYPSHSVFYNYLEWLKNQLHIMAQWWVSNVKLDTPLDFLIDLLKEDFNKYFVSKDHLKKVKDETLETRTNSKDINLKQDKNESIWNSFQDLNDLF